MFSSSTTVLPGRVTPPPAEAVLEDDLWFHRMGPDPVATPPPTPPTTGPPTPPALLLLLFWRCLGGTGGGTPFELLGTGLGVAAEDEAVWTPPVASGEVEGKLISSSVVQIVVVSSSMVSRSIKTRGKILIDLRSYCRSPPQVKI